MEESLTISKKLPAFTSMQYTALRELGIKHIQELAGKLWTDYNTHDPGITILEALSYVITDLGYRVNYEIKDILAQNLNSPDYTDIKNFYTACQILPNCPVTENDFRKLMIDVEVIEQGEEGEEDIFAGVKNSWIEKSSTAEHEIYVNHSDSVLSLEEVPGAAIQDSYFVKALYNVLLEFDKTDEYGDLNSNTIESDLTIYEHTPDPNIEGLTFSVKIEFPSWDDQDIDWEDPINIQANINEVTVKIFNLPDNYKMESVISNKNEVILTGIKDIGGTETPIDGLDELMNVLFNFMYDPVDGLLPLYVEKVAKIHEIVDEVRATLHANRNLCDDYFQINALKIEEIILCTDLELHPTADIDEVEATIFKKIAEFLSPQVTFYTLEEMLDKCNDTPQYTIKEITKSKNTFTIDRKPEEDFNKDDTITLIDSGKNDGKYTIKCLGANKENPEFSDIEVVEDVVSADFDDDAYLIYGTTDDSACLTVDKIFEGPKLKHGFIDNDELESANRLKVIHVSDLIRIIMDIEGVIAVKSIQIANRPQDNDENIESKSVKWCLELAFDKNYVPRLNIDDSKITHYKEQLPFLADRIEVKEIIEELEEKDRPQKIRYPIMDIPIPTGEFRDIDKYTSVQEDFPLAYGIGVEGIPGLGSLEGTEKTNRQIEVYQLKEFLLFFDQLLANYLSQLANVKYLFSMNGEKNSFGQYLIDRTYFTQSLFGESYPEAMYVDQSGHAVALQKLTEDQELYEKRRNKFLDHMLGRFAETFSDYALLSFKMSGNKADAELIEDKLKFLNDYPDLSKTRGKGFNYYDPCEIWHVDNESGLDKRVSLLSGIEEKTVDDLKFSDNFIFIEPPTPADPYELQIVDDTATVLLTSGPFSTEDEILAAAENIIVAGLTKDNFEIVDEEITFSFQLSCDDNVLAVSERTDFVSDLPDGDADNAIDELIEILTREFYSNPESNRKNLACPLLNYFAVEVIPDMTPVAPAPPQYTISYTLYNSAFEFVPENALLTGFVTEDAALGDTAAEVIEKGNQKVYDALWNVINNGMERGHYVFDPENAPFSSPYAFVLHDKYGNEIARSVESDFNNKIASEALALTSGVIEVSGSTDNDGTYSVTSASGDGPFVILGVSPTPTPPIFDGQLFWSETFAITQIDQENRSFDINHDISSVLSHGDLISVQSSESNDADYTILNIEVSGSVSTVFVKETIASDNISGDLTYTKAFEITGVDTDQFTIRGGEDEEAILDMIDTIGELFFSHEGMHIIEHVLLRPRVNEPLFVDILNNTLSETLATNGELHFQKTASILTSSKTDNNISIAGDITTEIVGNEISIDGGSFNDDDYIISQKIFNGTDTIITVDATVSKILYDLPDGAYPNGELVYTKKSLVNSITASTHQIVISDVDALDLLDGDIVEIKGSSNGSNDFRFTVVSVTQNGSDIEIIVDQVELLVQDDLLPVHLDQDCGSCQITDPYSFVTTVVLPYWPDRFINMDFRNFMDKALRREAPAHVLLNICWIDCRQMHELETKFKAWLVETGRSIPNKAATSQALSELIDILTRIRNVYPTGTLHDCEEDENLEGAIILNNSVLGTF